MTEDRRDYLWIASGDPATEIGGLQRYDPATGTFTTFRHDPDCPFFFHS